MFIFHGVGFLAMGCI